MKNFLKALLSGVDCLVAVVAVLLCYFFFILSLPWVLKKRKRWISSAKGNPKVLIVHGFNASELQIRGYEFLLPFRNHRIKWVGLFDPVNSSNEDIRVEDDFFLIARRLPKLIKFVTLIGLKATSTIFREFYSVYKIADFCVQEKVGILRAYKHNFPALRVYLVSCLIKIPFIVDITGNYELIRRLNGKPFYFRQLTKIPFFRIFAPALTNWLLGLPLKHATYILGRNKNNYEHAFALGAAVEKMSLLRVSNFNQAFNVYDPDQLPPPPMEAPYVLFVGRLVLIKFPFDVIDAFEMAAAKLADYRLVMIGDGALRQEVVQRIESSAFKDRIVFLGSCSSDTVFNWTAHAKIAVCPFSGYTLAESMLCGVPVIAYDVENHSEVVIDGYTGFLVPFRNIRALSKAIVSVANNYEEARSIGLRGRELARVAYDKERIMEKEGMVYIQALDLPAPDDDALVESNPSSHSRSPEAGNAGAFCKDRWNKVA
jgi:glycosyltransferase involved in cell wall biosynthesis